MGEEMTLVGEPTTRLKSAVSDFAQAEIIRIALAVIAELKTRQAIGIFGDVAARNLWDEYCWSLRAGPFDDDEYSGGGRLGSVSGNLDDIARSLADLEVVKLSGHALVLLSAHAFDERWDGDEDEAAGVIWGDGVVHLVMEEIDCLAARRNLDLVGPDRCDFVGYEIEGSGIVWSALSERGEAFDLITSHAEELLDPDGDLSELAGEMTAAFMEAAREETTGTSVAEFFDNFGERIAQMLTEDDVLPALSDARSILLERMDG